MNEGKTIDLLKIGADDEAEELASVLEGKGGESAKRVFPESFAASGGFKNNTSAFAGLKVK